MTMRVSGPQGLAVNFPDGTDEATIDKVMRDALTRVPRKTISAEPPKREPFSLDITGDLPAPTPVTTPPPQQPDLDAELAEHTRAVKTVNGRVYRQHRDGTVWDEATNQATIDPGIIAAFGQKKPTTEAQKEMFHQQAAPSEAGYLGEGAKGVGRGALSMTGEVLKGTAAVKGAWSQEILDIHAGIDRVPQMDHREYSDYVAHIKRTIKNSAIRNPLLAMLRVAHTGKAYDPEAARRLLTPVEELESKVTDNALYQAGETLQQAIQQGTLKPAPGWEKGMYRDVMEGFGSLVPLMGLSMSPLGLPAGLAAAAATGAADAYGRAERFLQGNIHAERAQQYDVDQAKKQMAHVTKMGALVGTGEMLPVEFLLRGMALKIKPLAVIAKSPALKAAWTRYAGRALAQGGVETVQEGTNRFLQNLIEQGYHPGQELSEGVAHDALIGAFVGAGAGASVGAAQEIAATQQNRAGAIPPPSPAEPPPPVTAPLAPPRQPVTPPGPGMAPMAHRTPQDERTAPSVEPATRAAPQPVPTVPQPQPEPAVGPTQPDGPPIIAAVPPQADGSKVAPIRPETEADIAAIRPRVTPEPSDAQKDAGNYRHAHIKLHGMDIAIETPKGGIRRSRVDAPEQWEVQMPGDYGRIKGTKNTDGEEIDITIGPNPESTRAMIIAQRDLKTGKFDEFKVIAGINTKEDGEALYDASFSDGRGKERIISITHIDARHLPQWAKNMGSSIKSAQENAATSGFKTDEQLAKEGFRRGQIPGTLVDKNIGFRPGRNLEGLIDRAAPETGQEKYEAAARRQQQGTWREILERRDRFSPNARNKIDTVMAQASAAMKRRLPAGANEFGPEARAIYDEELAKRHKLFETIARTDRQAAPEGGAKVIPFTPKPRVVVPLRPEPKPAEPSPPQKAEADQQRAPEEGAEPRPESQPGGESGAASRPVAEGEAVARPGKSRASPSEPQSEIEPPDGPPGFDAQGSDGRYNYQERNQFRHEGSDGLGEAARDYVLENGRGMDREFLLILDAGGNVVFDAMGDRSSVGFSSEAADLLQDPNQSLLVHHNHPSSGSLSVTDLMNLPWSRGLAAIWAHGHDGTYYRAALRPGVGVELQNHINKATGIIHDALQLPVFGGEMPVPEAARLHAHLVNLSLHRAGVIDYLTDYQSDRLRDDRIQEALNAAVAEVSQAHGVSQNEQASLRDDRRAQPVRHVGDLGEVPGRGAGVAPGRQYQKPPDTARPPDDRPQARREKAGRPDAEQLIFLEKEGLAEDGPADKTAESPRDLPAVGTQRFQYFDDGRFGGWRIKIIAPDGAVFRPKNYGGPQAVGGPWPWNNQAHAKKGARAWLKTKEGRAWTKEHDKSPEPAVEPGAEGKPQTVLPGAERASPGTMAQRGTDAPLKPKAPQKPADEGLFGDEKDQLKLLEDENPYKGGPAGFSDPADDTRGLYESAQAWTARVSGRLDVLSSAVRRKMQDRFIDVRRIQEDIKAAGRTLIESSDVYRSESLYHGKVAKRIDDFELDAVKPLIEQIGDAKLSREDVDLFLYARHALERNPRIASINPKLPDGGSGMTDAEARAVIAGFRQEGKLAALRTVGDSVDAMNRQTRRWLLDAGLISQEQHDAWDNMYSHYVPLRGWESGQGNEDPARPNIGNRFDIRGKEAKPALGRRSKADSPLAYSIMQAQQAIVRGEKNTVDKTFLRMVRQHPNPDLWEVNKVVKQRYLNPKTGLVQEVAHVNDDRKNTVAAKFGGTTFYITVHDKNLVEAMKGLSADNMGLVGRSLHTFARYLSFVNTALSPEFIISNFFRDLQTAMINLSATEAAKLRLAILRDIPLAIGGGYKNLRGNRQGGTWARHFDEYAKAGGKIGFFGLKDIEAQKKEVIALLKSLDPSTMQKGVNVLKGLERWIMDTNGAVENGVRLSAYVNARRIGLSEEQSASLARELTVNFNG